MAKQRKYKQRTARGRKNAAQLEYLSKRILVKHYGECDLCGDEKAVHVGEDKEGKRIAIGLQCLIDHWKS